MNPLTPILAAHGRVILDGAMATELERRGYDLADPLWSAKVLLEAPDAIRAVHADYLTAGADVLITATYQATFEGFARRGIDHEGAAELLFLAVRLAMEAREAFWSEPANRQGRSRPLIAASIGPFGAYLADGSEYRGGYGRTVEALMNFHRPRMALLAGSGVDLLACETIPSATEAEALSRLLTEFPHTVAWFSFCCRDGGAIAEGASLAECVAALEANDAIVAVGVNCTAPRFIDDAIATIQGATDRPIVVYPNSGEAYDVDQHAWFGSHDAVAFGEAASRWRKAGAAVIGGCCRTGPDDIRQIYAALT
jgi:homocysteine S-methyltransferase